MKRVLLIIVVLLPAVAAGGWLGLRASLPLLDGAHPLAGLGAPVGIERDALGVTTIAGRTRLDVARATGFVHAQDRFFQMDLMRRDAAGELAALFGPKALERDRARRLHRLRDVARRALAALEPRERALLEAYAAGANAGLGALAVRPFEYLVLRASPAPWRAEDSLLAILAMFLRLTDEDGGYDSALGHLRAVLPPEVLDFLVVAGTGWDVPLTGTRPAPAPLPGPGACDVRAAAATATVAVSDALRAAADGDDAHGSNAWALGRERTGGAALVADDMHLGLAVPNVWYRARLVVGAPGEPPALDITGVTLPGTPAVAAGSNGHIAWGFTNSNGDWTDVVALELDRDDPERYATSAGFVEFGRVEETIAVRGEPAHTLAVRTTRWGPVPEDGPPRAVRWLAHLPDAIDLGILALESARDVPEAIAVAQRAGIPPQNLVVGDRDGRVGWTIMGRIPVRAGHDGRFPVPGRHHGAVWAGWQPPAAYPAVIDPPGGRIWTANARVVFGPGLAVIGEGNYVLGARAHQVHAGLMALDRAGVSDMLAVQLDDRALFLERWRELALAAAGGREPRRDEALSRIERWQGRAADGAVGYRLVREFRTQTLARALGPLLRACGDAAAEAAFGRVREAEGPLWRLVSERPLHLLDPRHADWDALLVEALDAAVDACGEGGLAACTWGDANQVEIAHPMSRALPALARWLDMPPASLPGDIHMPRVQKPRQGASERFGVSPGAEAEGYFHMPAGQSGHPLSPFYRAGHEAWARGEPLPFLPGPARHRLRLEPAG